MLGLGHQVGRDVRRDRAVVGQDPDLGRTGFGVDAAPALDEPLGGGDVDVAGAGDDVDRTAPRDPVRQHRNGLGAADGPHLRYAEQGAGGQHDGVRQAVGLRGARDGEAVDAGDLGGDDVHHDAARVGDAPTRHVQPDPADRHPALGHGGPVDDVDHLVVAQLRRRDGPRTADGLLQGGPDTGVEPVQSARQGLGRHPQRGGLDPVEAQRGFADGRLPAVADRLHDRPDLLHRGGDVEQGARQQRSRVDVASAAQVDAGQHEDAPGSKGEDCPAYRGGSLRFGRRARDGRHHARARCRPRRPARGARRAAVPSRRCPTGSRCSPSAWSCCPG